MSPMDVGMHNKYVLLTVGRKFMLPACRATATAIDRYLLPAPDLSSKPAGRRCSCCRSTGQTGGQTGGRTLDRFTTSTAYYADRKHAVVVATELLQPRDFACGTPSSPAA